jgi:hypothetical protein
MNCKPGDLAIVVDALHNKNAIGTLVEVLRPAIDGERIGGGGRIVRGDSGHGWVVCRPGGGPIDAWSSAGFAFKATEALCLDRHLRPIRDPGDDATDESRAWLPPVPYGHPIKEAA